MLLFIGIAIQIISITSSSHISSSSYNYANTVLSGIIGGIIGIAINVVVAFYLCRRNVKAYFGKAHPLAYIIGLLLAMELTKRIYPIETIFICR